MPKNAHIADIKEKVWKVFQTTGGDTRSSEIRVVSWIYDGGKETKPTLEKREKVKTAEFGWRLGKNKGFTADDLKFVVENSGDIINLMEGTQEPVPVEDYGNENSLDNQNENF